MIKAQGTIPLSGLNSPHGVGKDLIDIRIRERSGPHLQSIIDRAIENIDDRIRVCVWTQEPLFYALFEVGDRHPPSRYRPAIPQRRSELGIKLCRSKQRTDQRAILSSKELRHCSHLDADAIEIAPIFDKERIWIDPRNEGIHNDRRFVRPAPVDGHSSNFCLCGDRVHTERSKALAQGELSGCGQYGLMDFGASGPAPLRGSGLHLILSRFHITRRITRFSRIH